QQDAPPEQSDSAAAGDAPPRRLSVDPKSPHYSRVCPRVGVRLDGVVRPNDVAEYDAVEGWVRTESGRTLYGSVEPYWRDEEIRAAQAEALARREAERAAAREGRMAAAE